MATKQRTTKKALGLPRFSRHLRLSGTKENPVQYVRIALTREERDQLSKAMNKVEKEGWDVVYMPGNICEGPFIRRLVCYATEEILKDGGPAQRFAKLVREMGQDAFNLESSARRLMRASLTQSHKGRKVTA